MSFICHVCSVHCECSYAVICGGEVHVTCYSATVDICIFIISAKKMAAKYLQIFSIINIVKWTPMDQYLLILLLYTNKE